MIRRRRLRVNETIRELVRETSVQVSDLIYPIFVIEGENQKNPVDSMPGIYQYSLDRLGEELVRIKKSGVKSLLIFGIPAHKDETGSEAYNKDGIVQKAIRYIKAAYPEFILVADICLCEYTSHGHCGLIKDGVILNDETLPLLAEAALTCAQAGADMIAPSDMMDGHIGEIRKVLDNNGFINTPIMAYSAKYASGYYAPFRDAAHSAPGFGDRKTYQMDYANSKEALREVFDDIKEGADIVMIKPALAYLDVIKSVALETDYPIAAYNVSGEYAMVKAAAMNGWIDEKKIVMENITAMKRAGAKIIITYHALEVAGWIKEMNQ
ncbi:porphobilinogen synthase [Anaerocolumna sp. AGMB13025]|uniref:porphobilinogen synthase n=1 Tax=Anaerocolumna sp. AGMB13025 TaxID=3039116 RepID=UPI00241CFB91|nr:porphobilinogen synthase [Anaerocolumna sp. AGMB13025]WFR60000.1 porphobilinogen synthase [Anaerocolumna sp. AGMB13025]